MAAQVLPPHELAPPAAQSHRWRWWGAWVVAGALVTSSLVAGFGIGLFVAPFALLALFWLARRGPGFPEVAGAAAGAGLVCLLIAFLNRDSAPCPDSGRLVIPADAPAGTVLSCGGLDPRPWLLAGVALCALGCGTYAVLRPRGTPDS